MANEKRFELINKWDVVNKLIRLENSYNFYKDVWDAQTLYRRICELEIGIGKTPTVDAVEVVHGYWIDSHSVDHMGRIVEHGIDCSVCESVFKDDSREVVKHWKELFKTCPFCGALMDGKREDGVGDE